MKKLISCALALFCIVCAAFFPAISAQTVCAQNTQPATAAPSVGGYACILTDNVYFYSSKNEDSGLFLLPESYFVKILETGDTFCKIEYLYDDAHVKKLIGYARTAQLAFVDYVPERPYLYCLFNLRYTLGDSFGGDGFLDNITVTCAYYGDYAVGSKLYCYVLQGEDFGYVPKPTDLTFEKNTEYTDRLAASVPDSSSPPTQSSESPSSAAQIAILVALCLLVPILAALVLKPPRRPPYESD